MLLTCMLLLRLLLLLLRLLLLMLREFYDSGAPLPCALHPPLHALHLGGLLPRRMAPSSLTVLTRHRNLPTARNCRIHLLMESEKPLVGIYFPTYEPRNTVAQVKHWGHPGTEKKWRLGEED
ncbi:hypothetical protein B0H16DRAFT_1452369 [Mycena metata]|uniref:Secreted protein n=1 Tax=Mycena metata TaxID=1033252 RepID=A0AAD7NPR7_9AGAR|nr:hypothetical protein B0H16DRAFT_1452369 [Mycena metata]